MSISRTRLEKKYQSIKVYIANNVGPKSQGRYSVEISDSLSVLGTCDTLYECEGLIEDYIERRREEAERGDT